VFWRGDYNYLHISASYVCTVNAYLMGFFYHIVLYIQELPQYLTSLHSDLIESQEKEEEFQFKLEENMLSSMTLHQEEVDNKVIRNL